MEPDLSGMSSLAPVTSCTALEPDVPKQYCIDTHLSTANLCADSVMPCVGTESSTSLTLIALPSHSVCLGVIVCLAYAAQRSVWSHICAALDRKSKFVLHKAIYKRIMFYLRTKVK